MIEPERDYRHPSIHRHINMSRLASLCDSSPSFISVLLFLCVADSATVSEFSLSLSLSRSLDLEVCKLFQHEEIFALFLRSMNSGFCSRMIGLLLCEWELLGLFICCWILSSHGLVLFIGLCPFEFILSSGSKVIEI